MTTRPLRSDKAKCPWCKEPLGDAPYAAPIEEICEDYDAGIPTLFCCEGCYEARHVFELAMAKDD